MEKVGLCRRAFAGAQSGGVCQLVGQLGDVDTVDGEIAEGGRHASDEKEDRRCKGYCVPFPSASDSAHGGENPPIASTSPPTLYFVHLVDAGTVGMFWANMARRENASCGRAARNDEGSASWRNRLLGQISDSYLPYCWASGPGAWGLKRR